MARFRRGPLVGDAGIGTEIYSRGVFINTCYDELNATRPELIASIHAQHVEAGAEVIETNTFGANWFRLARHGLEASVREFNIRGVEIAREAAGDAVLVAGSMGPLGIPLEPIGRTSLADARAAFRAQAEALRDGGADILMLETFSSLEELREAVRACREVAPDLVLAALATFNETGRTPLGTEAEAMAEMLVEEGADILGANCSTGPGPLLEVLERLHSVAAGPFALYPNAGLPQVVEERLLYMCSPEYLGKFARRFVRAAPMAIIGGCCGTTSEHVRALRDAVRSVAPSAPASVLSVHERHAETPGLPEVPFAERTVLASRIAMGRFVVSVEVNAPKGVSPEKAIAAARMLKEGGVDAINIADGPRATARMSNQALAVLMQREVGVEVILHFCCRDRNLLGMQGDLIGAHALGLRNILCVTGDPPRMGDYPRATAVFDVDSIGLVQLARRLNQGLDASGNAIGDRTALALVVAANPAAVNLDEEVRRFEYKVEAGAEACMTQPVYDVEKLHRFLDRTKNCRIPTLVGILPLASYRNAEFLHEEVPGMSVPDAVRERMRRAPSAEAAEAEGILIAQEALRDCRSLVQGAYIMPPLGRYKSALRVLEGIR